ncbi:hypothetical protein [Zongyangia hominis]|uniref:Uncharacterized protein n=1 Tax=Zongyangia hominis TaxID=2763677 RepID=A0A926IAU9_9FIRM|nr:hypothetical protein [Zongyangia hominis]MBC8569492.1 hypothetical protein [Zongyangia hominis]
MKREEAETMILAAIQERTGNLVEDKDTHLLSGAIPIPLVDWLYVFDALEQKTKLPVARVLEDHDYTVFTVRGLAGAICERWGE